jgi:hypothetical protein
VGVWGRGESQCAPVPRGAVSNLRLQKGTLPPGRVTCKKIAPAAAGACSLYVIAARCTQAVEISFFMYPVESNSP